MSDKNETAILSLMTSLAIAEDVAIRFVDAGFFDIGSLKGIPAIKIKAIGKINGVLARRVIRAIKNSVEDVPGAPDVVVAEKNALVAMLINALVVTDEVAEGLFDAGYTVVDDLSGVDIEKLKSIKGIGDSTAEKILAKVSGKY